MSSFENIPAYNWKAPVSTSSALPTSGNSPGDVRLALDTSLIYAWTGSAWTNSIASGGITTLNTLTAASQTFAVGTSGTDFAISSATSTHTFNIPDAGASARGLVTTGTQTFAGIKTVSSSFRLSDGSASSPSIGFTNNTNMGLYRRTSNITSAVTNGSVCFEWGYLGGSDYYFGSYCGMVPDSINSRDIGNYGTGANYTPYRSAYFGTGIVSGTGAVGLSLHPGTPTASFHAAKAATGTAVVGLRVSNDSSGHTTSDGFEIGIDNSATPIALIKNRENSSIQVFTNNTEIFRFLNTGGLFKNVQAGNESTGAGAALLGSNSPASTLTNPYTWITIVTSDGSTGYIPVWK